jgi:hypothetical protein
MESLKDRGKPMISPAFPGARAEPTTERSTGQPPISFPGQASSAIAVWQEKLEFLRAQEPLAVAADHKFALKKLIGEAENKIKELVGNP